MKCHCNEIEELRVENDVLRDALTQIVTMLGPEHICTCEGECHGLKHEAEQSLQVARRALGMTHA